MIKNTFIYFSLGLSTLMANGLDDFFKTDNVDITDSIVSEKIILERKVKALEKQNALQKMEIEDRIFKSTNPAPNVYFKQPKVYTIYTREELRSWGDFDVVLNAGWKTVVVGKHRLILNNEMKIK